MKIQICSDLHINLNKAILQKDINFNFKKYPLFIAGDVNESADDELSFLKKLNDLNIETFIVAGNHLGYDYIRQRVLLKSLGIDKPLVATRENYMQKLLHNDLNHIHYLENSFVEFDKYIVYGGTMFSDYKLYPKEQEASKQQGERWLNDFKYVYIFDKKQKLVRPVNSDDYIKYFKKFIKGLKKCLQLDKDIIVLSHFAPSIKSIDSKYLNRENRLMSPGYLVNASFASNLEKFIKQNPKIKYWIHGHMHDKSDYMIDNCRVICNPYGYFKESHVLPEDFKMKEIDI